MTKIKWSDVHILIVEDSQTQALRLQKDLETKISNIRIAANGLEGLDAIRENVPSVIISDIIMPGMNGYEFCKKVKSEINIPVILLTGCATYHISTESLLQQFADVRQE